MQDKLLDYLLGCLEAEDAALVEQARATDAEIARQLDVLRAALEPMNHLPDPPSPPSGLAVRTCQVVRASHLSPPAQ